MKKQYQQITADERDKIAVYKAHGFNFSDIAKMLGRNRSSIMREVKRNGAEERNVYTAMRAQGKSEDRKSKANTHERLKNPLIKEYVTDKLKEEWTPEIIAGRFKKDHPGYTISHEGQYISISTLRLRNLKCIYPGVTESVRSEVLREQTALIEYHRESALIKDLHAVNLVTGKPIPPYPDNRRRLWRFFWNVLHG